MSLTEFLLTRIADDEAAILSGDCQCGDGEPQRPDCAARVLAECEAKAGMLAEHELSAWGAGRLPICERCGQLYPCRSLRLTATVYADHLDYRQEWKP